MSTQSPLPQNDPMLIAFQILKKTPEYKNAVNWTIKAENENQAEGELWFGFAAGYAAAREIEIFQSYNEGIAWAADWLTGQAEANGDEITVFALNIADSIRAHKKPWNAVNNDRCDYCEHFHEMNQTCGKCGKTWSGDTRSEEGRNARY